MMPWLTEWGWVVLLVWLVLTKLSRHTETQSKKKSEKAVWDAEDIVATTMRVVNERVKDPQLKGAVLNEVSYKVDEKNIYRRALADGVIHLLERDPAKKFTPVDGSHLLDQLAGRAVAAKTRREKVKRGLKKAGIVALKIVRGGLL